MKMLELFCGTGSVGKAARTLGYSEVVSLDIDAACAPDILCDIMTWDYAAAYPAGYFDVVWASPPCTHYSCIQFMHLKRSSKERLEALMTASDLIVARVLEIIRYFGPKYWFMENPWSGALKGRGVVEGLPFVDGDYCQYGYPYRKRTRFWTNRPYVSLRLCRHDCPFSVGGRHICNVMPKGRSKMKEGQRSVVEVCAELGIVYDQRQRYSIPQPLLLSLLPPARVRPTVRTRN